MAAGHIDDTVTSPLRKRGVKFEALGFPLTDACGICFENVARTVVALFKDPDSL